MNDQILTEVNRKLDRLLSILDGPDELDERLYWHAARQFVVGNPKPMNDYLRRGGKIPHVERPAARNRTTNNQPTNADRAVSP